MGSSEVFMSLGSLALYPRILVKELPRLVMGADFSNAFTFDDLLFSSSCIVHL